jgi:uncharacterized cupin superfamily protein
LHAGLGNTLCVKATVVPGVWTWSVYQPDRAMDFNGTFVETNDGNFVVDPIAPDESTLRELCERGVAHIVITNSDHQRASAAVALVTGARIIAPRGDADNISVKVARTVVDGDSVGEWRVLGVDGAKTPGEITLCHSWLRTAIVGDVLWGTPAGSLTLMPDAKLADPARAALSLRRLRAMRLRNLLVGAGAHVFNTAAVAIGGALAARTDVAIARVNVDELRFPDAPNDPKPYDAAVAEVGLLLGASKLGYAAARLRQGQVFCPLHWHTREEELVVAMSGTPSVRTPQGVWRLRAGDCVAFVTDSSGAHSLFNDAEEEAVVLLIANSDAGDACFYPDSNKHVIEATGTLVRNEPELDYYDGEVPSKTLP